MKRPAAVKRPASASASSRGVSKKPAGSDVTLKFPKDFVWGSATASYQIEGGHEDGRSPCIWDTFCAKEGKVKNGDNGTMACDHYHRWKEDVALMKKLGLPAYRFSIAWSRLLPEGRGELNPIGVEFYNNLIDELIKSGIKPLVTIYHWDLPECLDAEYGGWLSRKIIDDFEYYSKKCFECFGDRVKDWITFNEPWCSTVLGYCNGEMAPGNKEKPETEPYLAAHHIILAHAKAVKCYRDHFKADQKGVIGITLNMDWREPLSDKDEDKAAAGRALDWQLGWYADPIWKGDYPETMKKRCGDRLPSFTDEEKALIKGTSEFFGLNHYSTAYASQPIGKAETKSMWGNVQSGGYFDDQECILTDDPRWLRTDMNWAVVPWGLKSMCEYIQREYQPEGGIIVTENGCAVPDDDVEKAKQDTFRVNYYRDYIAQLHEAIKNGADVRGYFAWSLMDNFEWALGYSKRFGMCHVDYETQVRTPKASALFISGVIKANALKISKEQLAATHFVMIEEGQGLASAKDNPDNPEKA
jgi:beta-galactosidase